MAWFKVDDGFYSHAKVLSIPRSKRATAIGTWIICGTWSADKLTDGKISALMVEELGGDLAGAEALVEARLWKRTRGGFAFVNWAEFQFTRSQVEENRAAEAKRKADWRARKSGAVSGDVPVGHVGDTFAQDEVSAHPVPNPSRPEPKGGETPLPPVDNSEPALRCPAHLTTAVPPKCGHCKDARLAHDAWAKTQAQAAIAARPSAWRPGLCHEHLQREDTCEMCERENRHAAEIIHGRFGTGAA